MKLSNTQNFVFKIILLILLVFGFIEVVYRVITTRYAKNAFTAALVDKHAYAKSISSPKIILIGGSNVAFGLNSEILSTKTNLPVVNMALLAPLGIRFILSDAANYINKGDIVIMSFEYDISTEGDIESQLSVVDFIPEDRPFVTDTSTLMENWKASLLHRLQAPSKIENIFEKPTVEDPYSIYFRKAFSKQGDIKSHLNNYVHEVHYDGGIMESFFNQKQIECLNTFIDLFRKKGAKVYFQYPTAAESFYQNSRSAIADLDRNLKMNLHAPLLSTPEQSVYPDSLFFDTVFHLKGPARDIRTEKVANALVNAGI
ncbi:hypothetical protein [Dyadobacter sp. 3J3]|uniref:hypothetical protein n=1 Tax=Dyadobacter sp. 3J3 TaxID=2606600 RepID=UPI001357EDC8|nr:hypothetical protein [Dyadobacter sp. 3J3]